MKITHEQKQVLGQLTAYYKQPDSYVTLGGYAGTGKTTLLAVWRKILQKVNPKIRVAFCAYTGKASQVLAKMLADLRVVGEKDSVSTIHSLIYAPITDGGGQVTSWKRKSSLAYDLIIVDEASMVDELLWQDLVAFQVPIVAVGDHGQLPPIGGKFHLMQRPDIVLETIHRQAAENPIINVSMMARTEGKIPVGNYDGKVRKLHKYDGDSGLEVDEILQNWSADWMVLVGYNVSRLRLNQQIREHKQFEGVQPKSGDRLLCLKNNWEKGIYNGMTGSLQRILPIQEEGIVHWYEVEIRMEDNGLLYEGRISAHQFHQPTTLDQVDGLKREMIGDLFDFGYALTVHKAQGSQAEKVLLFEERNRHMNDDDWRRWLYTAVTRAEEKLVIVGE